MKIGIDARLIEESGVGRYIKNLIENLTAIDKKNYYYLFFLPKSIRKFKFVSQNVKQEILPVPWHGLRNQIQTAKILNEHCLDLMHFPYFDVPIFYRGSFVVTIHDLIIDHCPTGKASTKNPFYYLFKKFAYKVVMKRAVSRAEKIITPSLCTKKELMVHYSVADNKIAVIYEGISLVNEARSTNILSAFNLREKEYFLYVGNAYPHKNLEHLLASFEMLLLRKSKLSQKIKLVMVGKNDFFYKRFRKLVFKKKLGGQIIFSGFVTESELRTLYKSALSFIFPSKMEGFGLPILEALACKCPVIASDIPVFHEIAGESVFYFDLNKKDDLALHMLKMTENDPAVKEKIEKGENIVRRYSFMKMAKQTLNLYENCFGL